MLFALPGPMPCLALLKRCAESLRSRKDTEWYFGVEVRVPHQICSVYVLEGEGEGEGERKCTS